MEKQCNKFALFSVSPYRIHGIILQVGQIYPITEGTSLAFQFVNFLCDIVINNKETK